MIAWTTEIAIVGAGAAGLAAASSLQAAGRDVRVFEARDRIGGRAYTIFPPGGTSAELGAEFIHGRPEEIFALLRATGMAALDNEGTRFEYRDGKFTEGGDLWGAMLRILSAVDPARADCARFGVPFEIDAQRCIVTVPVSLLRAQAIRFYPPLPHAMLDAINAIAMGPVVKLVLDFTEPFWEVAEGGGFKDAAFFQNLSGAFPTFWTMLPERLPRLIAWSGGGAVARMKSTDADGYVACALEELQEMFPDAAVATKLRAAFYHDWQSDPYARGAYSYLRVNGAGARERLGTPFGPLIFAGEATALGGESGTVGGALHSGYHAARCILSAQPISNVTRPQQI